MTGNHEDEDDDDVYGPVPHPDDRIWRHPAEMAAMAARADAQTAEVPAIDTVAVQPPRRLHRNLRIAAGIAAVGAAALTVGIVSGVTSGPSPQIDLASSTTPIASPPVVDISRSSIPIYNASEDQLAARIYEQAADSVPRVQAAMADGMNEGSGFFVTESGHIATSAELIADAEYVLVWTPDGQRWSGEVLAADPVSDVAVVRIDTDEWPAAPLGSDTDVHSGQYGLAMNHQDGKISIGRVAATHGSFLEVDQSAAVPGSAILDDAGVVIAMVAGDGSNRYAVPAWLIEQVSVDLLIDGTTTHTSLGVIVESDATRDGMVHVVEVVADSPAAKAGLMPGDLIDSLNSDSIDDAAALFRMVHTSSPGDRVVLTVTRHGNRRIVVAHLGELPPPN